jgi:phospholipid-binding lipoprotein MlaA
VRFPRWGAALAAALLSVGGASAAFAADAAPKAAPPTHPADPWEPFNRDVFAFNEALDQGIVRPVAEAYRAALPDVVRTGIGNVFNNVEDAWSVVNHFLQGKAQDGLDMTIRVATNSILGLAGAIDIASDLGIERRSEDFGQTLGRWGAAPGPYLVLPIFGPRTLRDAAAMPLDRAVGLSNLVRSNERYGLVLVEVVQRRSEFLAAGRLADQLAIDKYSFMRDGYLARRRSLVYDGNPPEEPEDDPAAPADQPSSAPSTR